MSAPISHRCDFVYLFDCLDGNPNGDPDAANQPRVDPQTLHGLVSDVCLKRKIRNFAQSLGQPIFVQHHGVLNAEIAKAEPKPKDGKERNREERISAQKWMCAHYYDVRSFGAVMSTGTNAGQVRGPVQLTFSRSIDPVSPLDLSITRVAITREEDVDKKETEMGRKNLIPYGLYRCHGFISANLAAQTGFSEDDLALLWDALKMMFDQDRSAARGTMAARRLIAFKHVGTDSDQKKREAQAKLGCAPAHKLFELVEVKRRADVQTPRRFEDYDTVACPPKGPLAAFPGVEVLDLV